MTVRPIIFSGAMVRALLGGGKTQTRRLATSPLAKCKPGDLLWVRENFHTATVNCWGGLPKTRVPTGGATIGKLRLYDDQAVYYLASFDRSGKPIVRPSIHMPRWASRLTLEVTAVRIEPLQKITGTDALAEGIIPVEGTSPWRVYLRLWNSLHGEGAWQGNPHVVALTFTVHKQNIDDYLRLREAA